jgi:hypothetical protein
MSARDMAKPAELVGNWQAPARVVRNPRFIYLVTKHRPSSRLLKNTLLKLDSGASENPGDITGGFLAHPIAVNFQFEQRRQTEALTLHPGLLLCSCRCRQRAHPHRVVHGGGKREHLAHPSDSTMPDLSQQPDSLEPPKDLFHTFAFPLTDGIARMASGPPINGAGAPRRVLGHMRRHPQLAQLSDTVTGIIVFVGAQGDPLLAGNLLRHRQGSLALGCSRRLRHADIDEQAMPILHEHMSQLCPLGLLSLGTFVQADLRVGRRGMRGIRAAFPAEVDAGIDGIIRG